MLSIARAAGVSRANVVDVPSDKLWKLGESPGISAVRAAGTMLAWTLPPKAQEAAPWRVTKWHGA